MLACDVATWATALVAAVTGVSAAVVLLIRELRREPSGGIPPSDAARGPGTSRPAGDRLRAV